NGAICSKVLIQADGKILAVGVGTSPSTLNGGFAIVRYNPNGGLDPSFGTGGKVLSSFGPSEDDASGAALQADGKIVAVGQDSTGNALPLFQSQFAVARYNQNGSLDSSFGSGGSVLTQIRNLSSAEAVAIQTDEKIVVAGFTLLPNSTNALSAALARYS